MNLQKSSLVLLVVAVLPSGFSACNASKDIPPKEKAPRQGPTAASVVPSAAEPPTHDQTQQAHDAPVLGSAPEFELVNQTGEPFGTWDLRGKIWIANFMFTRCQATCPRQAEALAQLQSEFQSTDDWEQIRFVSVTVDPEHDQPETLRDYAQDVSADPEHWHFLTGDAQDLAQLSSEGFKLPATAAGAEEPMAIGHSAHFVLVDPLERIRGYYDSLSEAEMARLRKDLQSLADAQLPIPETILDPPWMDARREHQLKAAEQCEVFHDFRFEDRAKESQIRFQHRIVDDAGKEQKDVHYDHGNGLAVADVDGDGRLDVYFTTQLGANELWRNLGDGKFENITQQAGVAVEDRVSVTASFADIDNDGDADLYVTTVRQGNLLFENDGQGVFRDITAKSGLGYKGHSSGAVFFDYDRDGRLDLFLCNVGVYTTDEQGRGGYYVGHKDAFSGHLKKERNERSLLFRNLGEGQFEDVTQAAQIDDASWTGDATFLDVNGDQWLDLYVLNMQGHDQYYESQQGKTFLKKSREVFPKTPWGAMGIQVFDLENDGDMDIFVTDMHSDMSKDILFDMRSQMSLETGFEEEKFKARVILPESILQSGGMSIFGNAFFVNQGGGQFEEQSDSLGAENYWPWGLSMEDLNADGFQDAFITSSMNYPYRYGVNSLLLNDRGRRLLDSEFVLGVEPRRDQRTAVPWFALDVSGKDKDHQLAKNRTGQWIVWGAAGSRSSAVFDLDQDGDLDIVTNEFNDRPMVLVSDLSNRREIRFLKLQLVGSTSNRDGLGARVTVNTKDGQYEQLHDGKSGYLSQSRLPLYFGLNDAEQVDSIEIVWPSGNKQVVSGPITTNQLMTIHEESK